MYSLVCGELSASLGLVLGGLLEAALAGRSPVRPLVSRSPFTLPALMLGARLALLVRSSAHPPDTWQITRAYTHISSSSVLFVTYNHTGYNNSEMCEVSPPEDSHFYYCNSIWMWLFVVHSVHSLLSCTVTVKPLMSSPVSSFNSSAQRLVSPPLLTPQLTAGLSFH